MQLKECFMNLKNNSSIQLAWFIFTH